MLLLAQGWSNQRIAAAMNITVPTLRKHYFSILKTRDTAADMVNARHLVLLWNQCEAGNVAALKEFARIMSNLMPETFKRKVETEKQQVGKKEQLRRDTEQPVSGWEGLVPPRDVVN
ncbi:MAG: hypothetical protein C0605_07735 [Hyphomicrobiales bacterium]|nr:MAG: hypothetical protein C0605_07735 [Hyphomicrobiales bacterium]